MPTVLIVDDDDVDRELAQRCLAPLEGIHLIFASNGIQALETIPKDKPDLILTDLRMPGMDGLKLVEHVRDEYSSVPIVLMTSQGSEQIAVKALKAGAASYVPKSDLKESLLDTIQSVLILLETRQSRDRVLKYLGSNNTNFDLVNDPEMIYPLAGYFHENLERLGFANNAIRTQIGMALMEAMANAMIHGNLEISSELRRESRSDYNNLIKKRMSESPYAERRVQCTAKESPEFVEYSIADEGRGFDPRTIPNPTESENLLLSSGRGIMLMQTFMDDVQFNSVGNAVVMKKSTLRVPETV